MLEGERMAETDEMIPTPSVGERLRAAREEKGLSLEEVASQTRIPRRHLEAIESADWERLPAATYTVGFAKSYASAVGLDRTEVGEEVRAEMGGQRPASNSAEVFEPADPARTMPRSLVIAAIVGIILVVIAMTWLNRRDLQPSEPAPVEASEEAPAVQPETAAPSPAAPAAGGPVVLTATEPAWIQVTDQDRTLFQGELAPGQSYEVPQTASAPLLRAGKPEALRVTVGGALAPPVGPAGRVASNVSLRGPDLMGSSGGNVTIPAPSAPPGVQNTTP